MISRGVSRMIKRNLVVLICILMSGILCTGCGHVKNAKRLIREARAAHGDCTVISQTETEDKTEVVLKDTLQGFEYTVRSYMTDINVDNTSFGSVPDSSDSFMAALIDYTLNESSERIAALLKEHNATFEQDRMSITVPVGDDGIAVTEKMAKILQEYNLENRMDGVIIRVGDDKTHLGSCRLPDISFRDHEKEIEDDYMMKAENLMSSVSRKNRSLTFVKKEKVAFSEIGIDLSRVSIYSNNKVEKESDPVTLYYFQTNCQTFYIADFIDSNTGADYTNFDLSREKEAKGEKGFIHINFNTN